ncbi:MAG: AMP-binding protein, partial [Gammaproteobacteria bacterium]|nr:AMP-binding protein [Gammaproteobacteria bacterium]
TGSLKMIAVGGGKVSRRLLDRAAEQGLPVYEGYGLSEAGSVTTLNLPGQTKPGSVGKPLPHAAVRVSPEGEIEVSGTLMDGYLGGHTGFDDWYATGDLGYIDEEGFVFISGRRDNLFVTSYGRNVNPEWIEAELGQSPAVAHVLVHGQALPHNLALIWPRFEMTCTEAAELVDEVNSKLPDYARINEHWVLREPIADDLVTANGRLKRQQVIDSYF